MNTAYPSMVKPLLAYCSTVWSPHTQEYIHKIEMVQRIAVRYVTNRFHNISSVTSMLDHLEWETLEARPTKNQLVKSIHGLVDIPTEILDTSINPNHIPALFFNSGRSQLPVTIVNTASSPIGYASRIPS